MIDGHGDDSYKYPEIRYNFSSNTRPGGMDSALVAHLCQQIEAAESYPEPLANTLAERIARVQGLPIGSVLVTNGAVEAFYLLAAWREKCRSSVLIPSFSDYEDACAMYGHQIDFVPNKDVDLRALDYADMFWLCNPNNPDGKVFAPELLQELIVEHPQTVFMLDEAYADFIAQQVSLEQWAPQQNNVVVVRSLTKRFSMPGLRLGYLVAHPDIIQALSEKVIPWRINVMAQQAGWYCFSEHYNDGFCLATYLKDAAQFKQDINAIPGCEVWPSSTPYFLVKTPMKASLLKEKLAQDYQILVRDASNFRAVDAYHIRLSTQSAEANNQLVNILKECF